MINLLQKSLNRSRTENNAIGYKTTGSALLDLNFSVSSLRNASEEEIIRLFDKAYMEMPDYTLKWLFFARDVRGGLGERRLFRICYKHLADIDVELFISNLDLISEYGRWDDLISLIGISDATDKYIIDLIQLQLNMDLGNTMHNKPISLLAKWLPSENASSKETKQMAKTIRRMLGLSSRDYRVMLSLLRKHSKVLEVQLCNNQWETVDYETVPSMANLKYKNAFLKHDEVRRREYLSSLATGKVKMNMSVASPVDVVSRYTNNGGWRRNVKPYDETLERAWESLDGINVKDTLVVADGSGSMTVNVNRSTTALDVANALAIYTSEQNTGEYQNKYITFSHDPQFVDFSDCNTLKSKLETCLDHNECSNTNIEKVFDLILHLAVANDIPQEEMIKNILTISDMEFDAAQTHFSRRFDANPLTPRLFDEIQARYIEKGYQLPRLIFWNVNSRTKTIPLIENELGVTLVSGFSQNVLKMVMSSKYDPLEVLKEQLDNERYSKVKT